MMHIFAMTVLQGLLLAAPPVSGFIYHSPIGLKHFSGSGSHHFLQKKHVNRIEMSFMSEAQGPRPPTTVYTHILDIGAAKGLNSPFRTLLMGFYSGCHIAFGKLSLFY